MIHVSTPSSTSSLNHPGIAEPRGFIFSERDELVLLRHVTPLVTAVLVDAAFLLKRQKSLLGELSPAQSVEQLVSMAFAHLSHRSQRIARLYRIFVYDAPPVAWRGHKPISKRSLDLSLSEPAVWRNQFHDLLRGTRKVALRLGEIPKSLAQWQLKALPLKQLLSGKRNWTSLTDDDFRLELRQKGVDMRIGLDIASLALKRQANQIVLISGDSDFVPAAKLARREGIDFVLDPMWASIRPSLFEHIDGLRSVCPKPQSEIAG